MAANASTRSAASWYTRDEPQAKAHTTAHDIDIDIRSNQNHETRVMWPTFRTDIALSLTVKLAQPIAAKMRRASSPHFVELSELFLTNPRCAERTISELEFSHSQDVATMPAGDYRQW